MIARLTPETSRAARAERMTPRPPESRVRYLVVALGLLAAAAGLVCLAEVLRG